MGNNKKKFEIPTTCALLFMLLLFCAVLTWIIPAGAYDTEKVGNTNRVIAGTYHVIESTPVGPWAAMMAVTGGFYKAAKLMIMIMFCGGAVEILEKSGAISAAFGKLASNKNMNVNLLVFILMAFMSIGGAAGVFANPVVALVPIGVILMKNLGYDAFAGFLLVYMGAYSGFNVGWANASTIGTAQPIAELPIFSGFSVRVILNVINFIICYFFTVKYMKTIKANPKKSLNYEEGLSVHEYMGGGKAEDMTTATMTWQHTLSLIGLVAAIAAICVGSIKFGWSYDQMGATFFILAVASGLINGMGINGTTKVFIAGCAKMTNAAFIVGFANGVGIVLTNGQILNTIVHWLSIPMQSMGSVMGANFMFIANLLINFLIPSGSGQAAAVMPIMVPMADLAGITRQVAVQAFQFGDGFSNCLYPTAGTLMGSLALAKTDWAKYAKWLMPLLGCQIILSFASLTILQSIGWTGL
ncbi:MAG: YfcC family protein [Lachnospiraceae bacterium]|nr:YfcC family protein [Lachnospiraceae bacterium]